MKPTTSEVIQLRPTTNLSDCSAATREWIRQQGRRQGSKIGQLPFRVWRLKAHGQMFHGKSRGEVMAKAARAGIEVLG